MIVPPGLSSFLLGSGSFLLGSGSFFLGSGTTGAGSRARSSARPSARPAKITRVGGFIGWPVTALSLKRFRQTRHMGPMARSPVPPRRDRRGKRGVTSTPLAEARSPADLDSVPMSQEFPRPWPRGQGCGPRVEGHIYPLSHVG